ARLIDRSDVPDTGAGNPAYLDIGAFELLRPGSVSGIVFEDRDANGFRAIGEPALSGWTVFADLNDNGVPDPGEPTAVTDASGQYRLDALESGEQVVRLVVPGGWGQASPAAGFHRAVVEPDAVT